MDYKLEIANSCRRALEGLRRIVFWNNPHWRHWAELALYQFDGSEFTEFEELEKRDKENRFAWKSRRILRSLKAA